MEKPQNGKPQNESPQPKTEKKPNFIFRKHRPKKGPQDASGRDNYRN